LNPIKLSENQKLVARKEGQPRFRVLASGRRFGKTYLAIYEILRAAAQVNQAIWYVAPSYRQAKQISWKMLKEAIISLHWKAKFNETDLSCRIIQSGSTISLRGADNYDSLRGVGINFLAIDETADVKQEAWTEVLRPTLSDTGGRAFFMGTPKGRNWFYDLYMLGKSGEPGWGSWQYTTVDGGNVPPEEVEAARRDLDELTFSQEYLASFVNFEGRAYYPFTHEGNCAPLSYDPKQPLSLCFDFNIAPGVCAVSQEQRLPNGLDGTGIIGEVHIPRNSNTPAVCRKIIADWGKHEGRVICYGDATGGSSGSAKVQGSDWDLIRAELKPVFGERITFHVKAANPRERARINAVNSRLKSISGEIRMMVDARKSPNVVRDFEGVQLLKGGSGEIDKKATPDLTHISDAIGYYVEHCFPVAGAGMNKLQLVGL
jgi:hypothetical protein